MPPYFDGHFADTSVATRVPVASRTPVTITSSSANTSGSAPEKESPWFELYRFRCRNGGPSCHLRSCNCLLLRSLIRIARLDVGGWPEPRRQSVVDTTLHRAVDEHVKATNSHQEQDNPSYFHLVSRLFVYSFELRFTRPIIDPRLNARITPVFTRSHLVDDATLLAILNVRA